MMTMTVTVSVVPVVVTKDDGRQSNTECKGRPRRCVYGSRLRCTGGLIYRDGAAFFICIRVVRSIRRCSRCSIGGGIVIA